MRRAGLILLVSSTMLLAANHRVGAPSLGYVYDADKSVIRPVSGVPGASTFQTPVKVKGTDVLALSSSQGYAFAVTPDGAPKVFLLDRQVRIGLDGARSGAVKAAVSPTGSALVLAFRDNHVQVFSGMPSNATLAFEFDSPGAVQRLAVSDDATRAALFTKDGTSNTLYVASSAAVKQIASSASGTSLQFIRNGSDVIYGDAGKVLRVQADSSVHQIASLDHEIAGVAADAQRAIVATSEKLVVVNLADLSSKDVRCSCTPTTVGEMAHGVFRVTESTTSPLWLLNVNGSEPSVVFVPSAGGNDE